jgi:lysozyme
MIRTVEDLIKRHEGLRLWPYEDTVGKVTIGYGRNLTDVGISLEEAEAFMARDVATATRDAETFPWYADLDPVRQAVIVDLCFNLGLTRLRGFRRTLAALSMGDYTLAATELLDSTYAKQVTSRAHRNAQMLASGEWPAK